MRTKAQRTPHVVERYLAHRLHAPRLEQLPEEVAIEIGSELTGFGVGDPGQLVLARCVEGRSGALVELLLIPCEKRALRRPTWTWSSARR